MRWIGKHSPAPKKHKYKIGIRHITRCRELLGQWWVDDKPPIEPMSETKPWPGVWHPRSQWTKKPQLEYKANNFSHRGKIEDQPKQKASIFKFFLKMRGKSMLKVTLIYMPLFPGFKMHQSASTMELIKSLTNTLSSLSVLKSRRNSKDKDSCLKFIQRNCIKVPNSVIEEWRCKALEILEWRCKAFKI